MEQVLYGLTASQIARLRVLLDRIERGELSTPHPQPRLPGEAPDRVIVGVLTGSAAACASLLGTPTVATMNVYSFSSTGTSDSGRDETVYNFAPQAATTDRWTVAERDSLTGKWIITTQYCS